MKRILSLAHAAKALSRFSLVGLAALAFITGCATFKSETGFTSLFDGRSLKGWTLVGKIGDGYGVTSNVIYCARGGGGNLFTEREYADFVLRFEFKLEEGGNNGIGIRAPLQGDAAYEGMEIQILEEGAAEAGKWGELKPEQFHGSVYGVIAARKGALRPPGQWNFEEIIANGRQIKVVLNGRTILDTSLNSVTDADKILKHPGLFRDRGHIGFLGHNDYVEFRNIRIKELTPRAEENNTAPSGFKALFNGKDLEGWKGLVGDPKKRASMDAVALAAAQQKADAVAAENWKVEDGALVYRGTNFDNLCTTSNYADFELFADWKIEPHADSGLYLRGTPQVQIWDPFTQPAKSGSEIGSGGLYNNKSNLSKPFQVSDKPVGEWNRFHIVMVGDKLHIFLNGDIVARANTLENYWENGKPLYPTGQIELQAHKSVVYFKNLYIRELK